MTASSSKDSNKSSSGTDCAHHPISDEVFIGPDINPTRSHMDRKLYRYITLKNGLKCVLISDTVAMRQMKLEGIYDDDSDEESSDDEGKDVDGDESNDGDDEEDDGLRKAAAALLVNVGSYHDPPYLQGLSHFLEHMLFLGESNHCDYFWPQNKLDFCF